jgi:hypothetical protein
MNEPCAMILSHRASLHDKKLPKAALFDHLLSSVTIKQVTKRLRYCLLLSAPQDLLQR